jgi:hypothetical protein
MNRTFDDFFNGLRLSPFGGAEGRFGSFIPTLDMSENDKELNAFTGWGHHHPTLQG